MDGAMFGAARYPESIISSVDQFDFLQRRRSGHRFLGMGEMDGSGNVNVSQLGKWWWVRRLHRHHAGRQEGGVLRELRGKGLQVETSGGRLMIRSAGKVPKLVRAVRHISFSGSRARDQRQEVLYVTERAVFRLARTVSTDRSGRRGGSADDIIERMGFSRSSASAEDGARVAVPVRRITSLQSCAKSFRG